MKSGLEVEVDGLGGLGGLEFEVKLLGGDGVLSNGVAACRVSPSVGSRN